MLLRSRIFLIAFLLLFGMAASALAQLDRGIVTGVVRDQTGAVVAGAKVTVTKADTNVQTVTTTTDTGLFTVPALLVGQYNVQVEASGFKVSAHDGVTVSAASTVRLDVTLELGAGVEHVEVSATAAALEIDSTRVATNLTNKLVDEIPLAVNGAMRSVFDLAMLTPGMTVGVSGASVGATPNFRIAGGQDASWEMQMDGMTITPSSAVKQSQRVVITAAPIDAISEFTVEANAGMKAEYGHNMGMISFVTKSGSDQYHGDAFEFLRNDAMDARGFFATFKPRLQQSDFGGTIGGPLSIPKVYNGRDKTFFFLSYEGYRQNLGASPNYFTVPSAAMYQGDFSGWNNSTNPKAPTVPIYDPGSTAPNPSGAGYVRQPFPNNQIPRNLFSPYASAYIGFRPANMLPNVPGAGSVANYFLQAGSVGFPWNKGTARIDHKLSAKDSIAGFFMRGEATNIEGPSGAPGLPKPYNSSGALWDYKQSYGSLSWTRIIGPHTVSELRFNKMDGYGFVNSSSFDDPGKHWGDSLGVKNVPGPDISIPPVSFVVNTGGTPQYSPWAAVGGHGEDDSWLWSLSESITLVRGAHTFKAGLSFDRNDWGGGGQEQPNGLYSFSQLATAIPGDQSQGSGNAFASFLLGYPATVSLTTPRHLVFLFQDLGSFFQDDWRVSPKLTVNLGIRYDYSWPMKGGGVVPGVEPGFSNLSLTAPNPAAGGIPGAMVFTGHGPGRTGSDILFTTSKLQFQPRAGMAYSLRPTTVLRVAGARGFEAFKAQGGTQNYDGFIFNQSYTTSDLNINNFPTPPSMALPTTWKVPNLTPSVDNGLNLTWLNPSLASIPAQFWTWNFDIQQQITPSSVLTARYVGIRGEHLYSGLLRPNQIDPNYLNTLGPAVLTSSSTSPAALAAGIPNPYPGFSGTVQQALSPFPQYKMISVSQEHVGDSTYHGLYLIFNKRYSGGLVMLASYSLSKMFTNADSYVSGSGAMNTFDLRLAKALSQDDQTHLLRYSLSYELPLGKGKEHLTHGLLSHIAGGWTIAGSAEYSSGLPLGIASGATLPIGGGANEPFITSYSNWRAPFTGSFNPFGNVWWNKSAFNQQPASVLSSSMGNSTILNPQTRLPWNLNENLNVARSFPIREGLSLTFRAEAFNILNRVVWASPDNTLTDAGFGLVRAQANNPRQLQMVLKLYF